MRYLTVVLFYFFVSCAQCFAQALCHHYFSHKKVIELNNLSQFNDLINKPNTHFYFSSELHVIGELDKVQRLDSEVIYYNLKGAVEIKHLDQVLPGQDLLAHPHGFGNPLGEISELYRNGKKINGVDSLEQLKLLTLKNNDDLTIVYKSGVRVEGKFDKFQGIDNQRQVLTFIDQSTEVTGPKQAVLFERAWGTYDLVLEPKFLAAVID